MPPIIEPDWPAPNGIVAFSTTRSGGHSRAPFNSFNLGAHVEDDVLAVAANREVLDTQLPGNVPIAWLNQVHGTSVVEARSSNVIPDADAVFSHRAGIACAVLSADCLPVLLCSENGDAVAAAHAGWRGLAAGVLENTVQAMKCEPAALMAWLGPAIGPQAFEVGPEVREEFLSCADVVARELVNDCFAVNAQRPGYFHADLYRLAKQRLNAAGVEHVFGGEYCTYADSERFFSYRRDGVTGRMASVISIA